MKKDNLIFIEKALMFPEVVKLVREASERIWYKVPDVTSFEHSCYRDIGIALMNERVKSIGGISTRIISRKEAWHVKNRGNKIEINSIEEMKQDDSEGNEGTFDIVDDAAVVDEEVIGKLRHKEIVELLAKNDDRRRFVLGAWTNGYDDDVELSNVLADVFGGKSTGQRRFIQRFEKECKERLATA